MFPRVAVKSYADTFDPSCSMPRGDAVQSDHFCSGNYMLKCGDMLRSIFMTVVFWVVHSHSEDTKPEDSQGLDDRWMFYQQDGATMQDPVQWLCSNNKVVGSSQSFCVCVMDRQDFEFPRVCEQLFICKTTSIIFHTMCIYNIKTRQEELIKLTFLKEFRRQLQSSRAVPAVAQFWLRNNSVCHLRIWWKKMDPESYC